MIDFELVPLHGGTVTLHDARRARRWSVDLDPFFLGRVPVTAELYARVSGTTPVESRVPVVGISWWKAVRFCNAASAREGMPAAYTVTGGLVRWHPERPGYRLPTEAEWEYACRAGSSGAQYGELRDVAWTAADDVPGPQPVGLKTANRLRLFDTLGNTWEWCWDFLDPARYNDYRVFRGGGFADEAWNVRASVRRGGAPDMHHEDLGFRIAWGPVACGDVVQGWSDTGDRERAAVPGPRPVGWTPQRGESGRQD
ncbi:MAG: formylglycine-rating enzyme family protein [Glaciihabitans sp.]|nr:formylglycine-rating enzyme family protein [Glaciihabitans sp.]